MEHRWHERRALRIELELYRRGVPVATCCSRNVSRDGMYFELDAHAAGFECGRSVQADFVCHETGTPRRHRVSGLIVHCGSEGMGILFTGHDPAVSQALDALIEAGGEEHEEGAYQHPIAASR